MSVREAVQLVKTIAIAVQEIHHYNIIHRDLKPGNILVRADGSPVVTDFGLALPNDGFLGDSRLSIDGTLIGSPAYMSPEQAVGKPGLIGPTADVYSLGVILFELITGELPFQGTVAVVLAKVINDSPSTPSSLRADVPRALDEICLKAMAKDPATRFSTMSDFADALDAYLTEDMHSDSSTIIPTKQTAHPLHHATVEQDDRDPEKRQRLVQWFDTKQRSGQILRFIAAICISIAITATLSTILFSDAQKESTEESVKETSPEKPEQKQFGIIRLVVDDPTVTVIVDGLTISKESLAHPVNLKTGTHFFKIKRGRIVIDKGEFLVRAQNNPPLTLGAK